MKVAAENTTAVIRSLHEGVADWKEAGRLAETAGDWAKAVSVYTKAIRTGAYQSYAYARLMIAYRRMKAYTKEKEVIDAAIAMQERLHGPRLKKPAKKIVDLSAKLNRAFGLTDRKGNNLYDPEPIARLKKRKQWVEKKIKSTPKSSGN